MRYLQHILMVFCLIPMVLNAQVYFFPDTIPLPGITVVSTHIVENGGLQEQKVDSIILSSNPGSSISEILSGFTPVFIKTYGQGSLATSSFRGAGATQTQVLWNDVPINSPMLGQTDFSLFPVFFIDAITLNSGANSLKNASGSFGGNISMSSVTNWKKNIAASLHQELGSFGYHGTFFSFSAGNTKFQSRTRLFFSGAENDFSFNNIDKDRYNPPTEMRLDAQYNQKGVAQDFWLRDGGSNQLHIALWAQDNDRMIPPTTLVLHHPGNESQTQQFTRITGNYTHFGDHITFNYRSAWLYDNLVYENVISEILSTNITNSFINALESKYSINSKLSIVGSVAFDYHRVSSSNYPDIAERTQGSMSLSFDYKPFNWLQITAMSKEEFVDQAWSPFIPLLGVKVGGKNKSVTLHGNIAGNYRMPSLNDLYWNPGGNPDLLPEKGYSTEVGVLWRKKLQDITLTAGATVFQNDIQNWIQWLPDSVFSYWTPQNLKHVIAKGIESQLEMSWSAGESTLAIKGMYQYVSATVVSSDIQNDGSLNKQLIYVPQHSGNIQARWKFKQLELFYTHQLYGKRYTSADNKRYMPAYYLGDCRLSYSLLHGRTGLLLTLKANNLFNTDYQAIAHQPMPGRHFSAGVRITFNKNEE